jgi:hypothetical protein
MLSIHTESHLCWVSQKAHHAECRHAGCHCAECRGATWRGVVTAAIRQERLFSGATTFSITTFSIMTLSIMTFSIMKFSIMTFSIMTFSIIINEIPHLFNGTQSRVLLCSVSFMLSVFCAECQLRWVSQTSPLCWLSLYWVLLCWVSWRPF